MRAISQENQLKLWSQEQQTAVGMDRNEEISSDPSHKPVFPLGSPSNQARESHDGAGPASPAKGSEEPTLAMR